MSSTYHVVKMLWLRSPKLIRQFVRRFWILDHAKVYVRNLFSRIAHHNDIYDEAFYSHSDPKSVSSAPVITETIISYFNPSSVMDVGCGTGALIQHLQSRSIQVEGLENSQAAIDICCSRGLKVTRFDIEKNVLTEQDHFDLVVSTEVAEHLPEPCADRYVDLLCGISDKILITAATPGQGGVNHVNEQPHEYWIDKFKARGFRYDKVLSAKLRSTWKEKGVVWWYHNNAMIFFKA